jgi:hypothetical protein
MQLQQHSAQFWIAGVSAYAVIVLVLWLLTRYLEKHTFELSKQRRELKAIAESYGVGSGNRKIVTKMYSIWLP